MTDHELASKYYPHGHVKGFEEYCMVCERLATAFRKAIADERQAIVEVIKDAKEVEREYNYSTVCDWPDTRDALVEAIEARAKVDL